MGESGREKGSEPFLECDFLFTNSVCSKKIVGNGFKLAYFKGEEGET